MTSPRPGRRPNSKPATATCSRCAATPPPVLLRERLLPCTACKATPAGTSFPRPTSASAALTFRFSIVAAPAPTSRCAAIAPAFAGWWTMLPIIWRRCLGAISREKMVVPVPVFLSSVSWGGKIAVALERRHPGLVDGLILLCPGFFPKIQPPLGERIRTFFARLIRPKTLFPIPLNDPELFTATPRWLDFLRGDPLSLHQATARFMIESARLDAYLRFTPKYVHVPTLDALGRAGSHHQQRQDARVHRTFRDRRQDRPRNRRERIILSSSSPIRRSSSRKSCRGWIGTNALKPCHPHEPRPRL